jgi:outer membrane lipopolysaccharide assembly protein LptE/RlpB
MKEDSSLRILNALSPCRIKGDKKVGHGQSSAAIILFWKIFFLSFACFLLVQCGYTLRGTGSFLPPSIKKICIPLFKNNTTRYTLDLKLTQAVIDEFAARGKVEVTTDVQKADAVLSGEILAFTVNPIALSGQSRADHYAITVVASIVLKEYKSERVIFSNPSYSYPMEYEVPEGRDFESSETEALSKLAELFARNLVIAILEGF